jgi:hypothetical protein
MRLAQSSPGGLDHTLPSNHFADGKTETQIFDLKTLQLQLIDSGFRLCYPAHPYNI